MERPASSLGALKDLDPLSATSAGIARRSTWRATIARTPGSTFCA